MSKTANKTSPAARRPGYLAQTLDETRSETANRTSPAARRPGYLGETADETRSETAMWQRSRLAQAASMPSDPRRVGGAPTSPPRTV